MLAQLIMGWEESPSFFLGRKSRTRQEMAFLEKIIFSGHRKTPDSSTTRCWDASGTVQKKTMRATPWPHLDDLRRYPHRVCRIRSPREILESLSGVLEAKSLVRSVRMRRVRLGVLMLLLGCRCLLPLLLRLKVYDITKYQDRGGVG